MKGEALANLIRRRCRAAKVPVRRVGEMMGKHELFLRDLECRKSPVPADTVRLAELALDAVAPEQPEDIGFPPKRGPRRSIEPSALMEPNDGKRECAQCLARVTLEQGRDCQAPFCKGELAHLEAEVCK